MSHDDPFAEIEQAEPCPVACGGEHELGSHRRAGGVELERHGVHAQRGEEFALSELEYVLGMSTHGITDDPRQDFIACVAVVPGAAGYPLYPAMPGKLRDTGPQKPHPPGR